MLSPIDLSRPFRTLLSGWTTRSALLGVASGAGFGIAAHVRTLALVEILFGYIVSRRIFSEHIARLELMGMLMLSVGLVLVALRG